MIKSIGIDSIEINRFNSWHTYSPQSLSKIFLPHETAYCISNTTKSAERFAIRFAAKEAFLKALSTVIAHQKIPNLLTVCKNVGVEHSPSGSPFLIVNWTSFGPLLVSPEQMTVHVSLTHTKTIATAFVILEQLKNI